MLWDRRPRRSPPGVSVDQYAIHQFGGVVKAKNHPYLTFKIGNAWIRKKEITIPARPFLKLTPQDETDLLDDTQDYFRSLGR